MGKSKQGGAFGFLRGKVGTLSYSVLSRKQSSSGKTEQVVRALPEQVTNPQTVAQCLQRMKLAPAQKFYKAFAELLNNAFQGVEYGDKSRQYFLSKAMQQEGPYIQRGVDRFIPAAYPFSEGTLPSVGIMPLAAGDTAITLEVTTTAEEVTPEVLANALAVSLDTQITVAVVNNVNGLFVPDYISYDDRLYIQDLPEGTLGKDAEGHITIDPTALGLSAATMVACCVVVSRQDIGGTWLRSTQELIINNELRLAIYSPEALEAAVNSYQDTSTVNSINSEWYYNLGMSQAFAGKLLVSTYEVGDTVYTPIIGIKQVKGRVQTKYFYTVVDGEERVVFADGEQVVTYEGITRSTAPFDGFLESSWELWQDAYAVQMGFIQGATE